MLYTKDEVISRIDDFIQESDVERKILDRALDKCSEGREYDKIKYRMEGMERILIPLKSLIDAIKTESLFNNLPGYGKGKEIIIGEIKPADQNISGKEYVSVS